MHSSHDILGQLGFAAAFLLLLNSSNAIHAQEAPSIHGSVRDYHTGEPLSGVVMTVIGMRREVRTDSRGEYWLPTGMVSEINLRLSRTGYATVVERVVMTGMRTEVDFRMAPVDAVLDALFVVKDLGKNAESEGGLAVRNVGSEDALVSNTPELLKGIPGALILRPNGQIGAGSKVQLRGLRSLFSTNEPLIYVDGVRTASLRAPLRWISSETILDIIPTGQIDRIEVFKGPSAAARFGTGALAGVIHIHTRKGHLRKPD